MRQKIEANVIGTGITFTHTANMRGMSSGKRTRLKVLSVATAIAIAAMAPGACAADPKPSAELAAPGVLVNIHNSQVPHDVPAGPNASIQDLAIFAWQEFVALNWPALDPATTGVRGRADPMKQFSDADPGLPVWQTYRHKNELFPAGGGTDADFDSNQPAYNYAVALENATPTTSQNLWNNLDESSEIGLCTLFANNSTSDEWRILFEAKVNRAVFDYANSAGLTQCDGSTCNTLRTKRSTTSANLASYGGVCSSADASKIVMLPCGDNGIPGDAGEGTIETKAAWRKLTGTEAQSGRFFTANIIYYEKQAGAPKTIVHNDTYGLVGFHIIHKTKSFPAYVFASWEQVDDYDQKNTSGLKFHNISGPPDIPVERAHAIPSVIQNVTNDVHAQLSGTKSVWQYYKLVGVQGQPLNGPPPSGAPADLFSYYYLANIVVETNQALQNFFGRINGQTGLPQPTQNLYLGGKPYQMGGCQGCHGFQGQSVGGDMSVLIGTAPQNSRFPEHFNDDDAVLVNSRTGRFTKSP